MVEAEQKFEPKAGLWRASCAVILATAGVLRLYDLNLVPLHHDEGVNGNFVRILVRDGHYQYNPQDFHGPTLYYFSSVIPWVSRLLFGSEVGDSYGLTTFTIRFVTALFGLATIWLVLTLRRRIGTMASLAAAALLAVSPGAVYLSRYFIHETLLVFFTLAGVIAVMKFYEGARSGYLLLASAIAALLFATKETAIISAGVLFIASISAFLFGRLHAFYETRNIEKEEKVGLTSKMRLLSERLGGPTYIASLSLAALSLFVAINVLFYSSFFTNYPQGLYDALKTFHFWTSTGTQVHVHPWFTYLAWMLLKESTLLLLGTAGAGLALWRARNTFATFTALWGFGMLLAYSLIPYKTPWLMLNFVVPLAITGGYAIEEIYKLTSGTRRANITLALTIALLVVSTSQTIALNFFHYDDPSNVYVYAHTYREFFPMVAEIQRAATLAGAGEQTEMTVTSPEYWPLPWYLRNYPRVKYYKRLMPSEDPIVIGLVSQERDLRLLLGDRYVMVRSGFRPTGAYPLRPDVDLVLFVRNDLAPK